jgi:hypothetical protein
MKNGEQKIKEVPHWGRADWTSMRQEMVGNNWPSIFKNKNAGEMWTLLKDRVGETVKKFVPIRAVSNRQRPAWMTREILQGLKRKRRLWKKAKSGNDPGGV